MSSLYHQAISTSKKLIQIPGFREILQESIQTESSFSTPTKDPVTQLWHCFRFGTSLCHILNTYRPNTIIDVNPISDALKNKNQSKANVYHFLSACKNLGLKSELFSISELYNDDTNGFIKVLRVVDELVEKMQAEGIISFETVQEQPQRARSSLDAKTHRDKVVFELVETERKFVHDLETLQNYMNMLQQREIVSKHTLGQIFSNLNNLVDFERKFLIALEDVCMRDPSEQHIGNVFIENEDAFMVYGPFCSNHQNAIETIQSHKEALVELAADMDPIRQLPSFLIKPIQRICRFPLLIRELIKYTREDDEMMGELKEALEAIERVTASVNETQRKEENRQVVSELMTSVEDWKGLRIQEFGDLLLHGSMIMKRRDIEKEVHMFLFEHILICCKENKKEKNKTRSIIRRSTTSSVTNVTYTLKGRVAISGVEGIVAASRNNQFDLKIFFRDNETGDLESVTLKFIHEEPLRKWKDEIEGLLDRRRRRSAPTGRERSRRNTESSAVRRRTAAQPANLRTNVTSIVNESAPRSAVTPDRLSMRRAPSTHISPLASPLPNQVSMENQIPNPPPRVNTIKARPEQQNSIETLDRFLNDLGEALKEGCFEDQSPIDSDLPPPLPSATSRRESEFSTGNYASHMSDYSRRPSEHQSRRRESELSHESPLSALPPPPSHPVPQRQLKLKIHTKTDIFMLLIAPDIKFQDLESKIRVKIGEWTRIKYEDEDGDYISLIGDDDLQIAVRLSGIKGRMNLYIE